MSQPMMPTRKKPKVVLPRVQKGPADLLGQTTGSTRVMCVALLVHGVLVIIGSLVFVADPLMTDAKLALIVAVVGIQVLADLAAPFLVARRLVVGLVLAWVSFCLIVLQVVLAVGTILAMGGKVISGPVCVSVIGAAVFIALIWPGLQSDKTRQYMLSRKAQERPPENP